MAPPRTSGQNEERKQRNKPSEHRVWDEGRHWEKPIVFNLE
jgi:hypothetical protein